MNTAETKAIILVCLFLLSNCGCDSVGPSPGIAGRGADSVPLQYAPVEIDILPLTCFDSAGDAESFSKIKIYVGLGDRFGSLMKAPGVFRFELYEYVERSARPRGRRIAIWPDVDLTESAENNEYWRDFLRVYQFELDFETQANNRYILQVTFINHAGGRLWSEVELKESW